MSNELYFPDIETVLVRYTVYATDFNGHKCSETFTCGHEVIAFMEAYKDVYKHFRVLKTKVTCVW